MNTNAKTKPSRLDRPVQYDAIGDLRAVIASSENHQVQWVKGYLKHIIDVESSRGFGNSNATSILNVLCALVAQTAYEVAQEAAQEAA